MPSKKDLKNRLQDAHKEKSAASTSLRDAQGIHSPVAKQLLTKFRQRLRDRIRKLASLIPKLRKRIEAKRKDGADKAVDWALNQVGVTESPSGSNWGHPVQDWIINAGYSSPQPWCGCFAHEAVVEHGKAAVSTQLGYAPNIISDANAGRNGLTRVKASAAKKGDIASLWHGEHVVILRGPVTAGGTIPTVEGNTSPATSGSQYNGGCVAAKTRLVTDVDVFARPNY